MWFCFCSPASRRATGKVIRLITVYPFSSQCSWPPLAAVVAVIVAVGIAVNAALSVVVVVVVLISSVGLLVS